MSALERARADMERGDLGSARRRLASSLGNTFDQDTLDTLGDICAQMGDPVEAGRYWLASSRDGEEVRLAVERFAALHRHDPDRILRAFPRHVALVAPENLPAPAADRIVSLGLEDPWRRRRERRLAARRTPVIDRVAPLGCVLAAIVALGLMILGAITAAGWILRSLP